MGFPKFIDVRVSTIERMRSALTDRSVFIEMHCFNKEEADGLRSKLSKYDRKRVKFFWLEFKKSGGQKHERDEIATEVINDEI